MSYNYQVVADQRVICPGCKKQDSISIMDGGPFDTVNTQTFYCGHCQSQFAVCNTCGKSYTVGHMCPYCGADGLGEDDILPVGTNNYEFIPDTAGRPNIWIHVPTGIPYNLAPGSMTTYTPSNNKKYELVDYDISKADALIEAIREIWSPSEH